MPFGQGSEYQGRIFLGGTNFFGIWYVDQRSRENFERETKMKIATTRNLARLVLTGCLCLWCTVWSVAVSTEDRKCCEAGRQGCCPKQGEAILVFGVDCGCTGLAVPIKAASEPARVSRQQSVGLERRVLAFALEFRPAIQANVKARTDAALESHCRVAIFRRTVRWRC